MSRPDRKAIHDPQARALVDYAITCGWTMSIGKGHGKLRSPRGDLIIFPTTGSDKRGHKNMRALMRRKGLDV